MRLGLPVVAGCSPEDECRKEDNGDFENGVAEEALAEEGHEIADHDSYANQKTNRGAQPRHFSVGLKARNENNCHISSRVRPRTSDLLDLCL